MSATVRYRLALLGLVLFAALVVLAVADTIESNKEHGTENESRYGGEPEVHPCVWPEARC